jgi:hypothetical protein
MARLKDKRALLAEAARAAKKSKKSHRGDDDGDDGDDAGPAAAAAAAPPSIFDEDEEPMVQHIGGAATDEYDAAMKLVSAPIALSDEQRAIVIEAAAKPHARPWLPPCHAGACE